MKDNEATQAVNVFSRKEHDIKVVEASTMAKKLFARPENALICVDRSTKNAIKIGSIPKEPRFSRILFLFTELPVELSTIEYWKAWVFRNKIPEYRMDFLRIGDFTTGYVEGRILRHCRNWDKERPAEEPAPDERWSSIGCLLDLSKSKDDGKDKTGETSYPGKDSPSLLTASFGAMGELMSRIYNVSERFKAELKALESIRDKKGVKFNIASRPEEIAKHLKNPGAVPNEPYVEWPVSFPKLLLYGETGVGKSLVSRYLHGLVSAGGKPHRISIPEFVGKEEYFEYALFGYAKGAYTGGLEDGSTGLLIENMGKVVFLDEIEEANNTIQAKLLTFMDDYRVPPRGWIHRSFYCPVLIVAATNCSVEELLKRHFRKDLLARFTDVETIPPLRERKESMDFIIDCLLQQDSINFERKIKRIGKYALAKLKGYSYEKGNFRELEDVLRNACVSAKKDGRDYLCECDIVFD